MRLSGVGGYQAHLFSEFRLLPSEVAIASTPARHSLAKASAAFLSSVVVGPVPQQNMSTTWASDIGNVEVDIINSLRGVPSIVLLTQHQMATTNMPRFYVLFSHKD